MKGIYFDGSKAVFRTDLPKPCSDETHSLVRVLIANICSTDREMLKGYRPDFKGIMGHEFVGVVEDSADGSLIGKTVVGELNEGCGECIYCKTGREKHCLSRKVIGLSKDGCFAEYMSIATKLLHVVPEGLSPEKAVFTEPLAAALQILEQVRFEPGKNVAIIGDGRLAFMIAQVLSLHCPDLSVIGRHEEKLKMFEPYAKTTLQSDESFEYVVDASGSESGFELALGLVRSGGTIVLKSTYAGKASVDLSLIPVREITIIGSRCGPFEPALELLAEGKVDFPPVELYDPEEYEAAFVSKAFKSGFKFG